MVALQIEELNYTSLYFRTYKKIKACNFNFFLLPKWKIVMEATCKKFNTLEKGNSGRTAIL